MHLATIVAISVYKLEYEKQLRCHWFIETVCLSPYSVAIILVNYVLMSFYWNKFNQFIFTSMMAAHLYYYFIGYIILYCDIAFVKIEKVY